MNGTVCFQAIMLCVISIAIEIASVTKDGKLWFAGLRQPGFNLSLKYWNIAGVAYYIIVGIVAYRLLQKSTTAFFGPILLLFLIMILNGLANFVIFKWRSLKIFYYTIYLLMILVGEFIYSVFRTDRVSAGLGFLYLLWLCYDLYYFFYLWQLNKQ